MTSSKSHLTIHLTKYNLLIYVKGLLQNIMVTKESLKLISSLFLCARRLAKLSIRHIHVSEKFEKLSKHVLAKSLVV